MEHRNYEDYVGHVTRYNPNPKEYVHVHTTTMPRFPPALVCVVNISKTGGRPMISIRLFSGA